MIVAHIIIGQTSYFRRNCPHEADINQKPVALGEGQEECRKQKRGEADKLDHHGFVEGGILPQV
ncbi:hypothetical protein D3C81_2190460 [compost metagenome]